MKLTLFSQTYGLQNSLLLNLKTTMYLVLNLRANRENFRDTACLYT